MLTTNTSLYGVILFGADNRRIQRAQVENLAEMLAQAGISCQFEVVPEAGHEYSPRYDNYLFQAIDMLQEDLNL